MSNTVSSNSASAGAVDFSKVEAGDTFTPDIPGSSAIDSSNSKADTSLLDNKSNSTASTDTGPNFPSKASDRKTTRSGRGMRMDDYGSSLNVMGNDSQASTTEQTSSAGEATAMAAGDYEQPAGPFSGSGTEGNPANKKLEFFS